MNFNSITLVFENLETATIKGEDLIHFTCVGLHNNIVLTLDQEMTEFTTCNELNLTINKNAAKNCVIDLNYRIATWNDIAAIDIDYTNGDSKHVYAPWPRDNEYVNEGQKTTFDENGNIVICIKDK